jgi:ketosteroid isomerase-like protein
VAAGAGEEESDFLRAFRAIYMEGNRAWNEGDFKRAYGALPKNFEYQLAPTWPNARPLRGPDEIVAFFEDWRETFPDTHSGTEFEFIEADERTMIVGFHVTGTGQRSGVQTEMDIWQIWEMGEGMVPVRVTEFPDRRAALEAAGAEEPVERQA